MTRFTPKQWTVLLNKGEEIPRILGVTSTDWRLNSGIVKIIEEPELYIIHGYSGSIYTCYKENECVPDFFKNVFNHFIDKGFKRLDISNIKSLYM